MKSIVKILMTAAALAAPAAALGAQPAPATQCTVSIVRLPTGDANDHAVRGPQSTTDKSKVSNANDECPRTYYPIDIAAAIQHPDESERDQQVDHCQ